MSQNTIDSTNPKYDDQIDRWILYQDGYYGEGGFQDGTYIEKFPRETTENYGDRKKSRFFLNYCAPVIDILNGHLFKQRAVRENNNKNVDTFLKGVDRHKTMTMNAFMKEVSLTGQIYGICFIVIDAPIVNNEEILTEADASQLNLVHYAYILSPQALTNWMLDERGKFLWAVIKEEYIDESQKVDPFGDHEIKTRYRLWERDKWSVWEEDKSKKNKTEWIMTDSGVNPLGEVPIIVHYNKKKEDMIGISEINTIVDINKDIYNCTSEIRHLHRSSLFPILTYCGNASDLATNPTTNNDGLITSTTPKIKTIDMGADTLLSYEIGATPPAFISPPATSFQEYRDWIKDEIEVIYQMAKLNYTGGVAESGVALAWKFDKTNQTLADRATSLQQTENEIVKLFCKWSNITDNSYNVQYPMEFGLQDLLHDLEIAMKIISLRLSTTFDKLYKQKLVKTIMPEINLKDINVINKEIEGEVEPQKNLAAEPQGDENVRPNETEPRK